MKILRYSKDETSRDEDVTQKLKTITINNKVDYTRLLPYVLVSDNNKDNSKIYNMKYIDYFKLEIEAIRNS